MNLQHSMLFETQRKTDEAVGFTLPDLTSNERK